MRPLRRVNSSGATRKAAAATSCRQQPSRPSLCGVFLLPDKLSHLLGFFALTVWFAALVERRLYVPVGLLMLATGIGIEIAQDLMALGRSAGFADVYADLFGIVLGLSLSLASRDSWLQRIERWLPRS